MQDAFPEGLADVPTGAALCALLAPVDARVVPDERLLEVLSAQYRQLAYQQAQVWATMAEVTSRNPMANVPDAVLWSREQIFESGVDEVRAELRFTRRTARNELE